MCQLIFLIKFFTYKPNILLGWPVIGPIFDKIPDHYTRFTFSKSKQSPLFLHFWRDPHTFGQPLAHSSALYLLGIFLSFLILYSLHTSSTKGGCWRLTWHVLRPCSRVVLCRWSWELLLLFLDNIVSVFH